MNTLHRRFLLLAGFALAACGPQVATSDGGNDVASGIDAPDVNTSPDAFDGAPSNDVGIDAFDATLDVVTDAGTDVAVDAPSDVAVDAQNDAASEASADATPDAPPPPFGCNPDQGIECDGDWAGRCPTSCPADQCCSPQHGQFACVPRDASGACPAADLFVDRTMIENQYTLEWTYISPGSCELVEQCVDAPGWRRLLRFSTYTPNIGTADMYLGDPTNPLYADHFTYSSCHMHYHFDTYAQYTLSDPSGQVSARGHKQAFCLLDLQQYSPGASGPTYNCGNQGIQMGWEDVYNSGLPCQWIDVTDVPAGQYSLHIDLNSKHVLNEINYDNNEIDVPVTVTPSVSPDSDAGVQNDAGDVVIVPGDPTSPCTGGFASGADRDCGWTLEGTHACTPGASVVVGCADTCSIGSCTGDSVLRVCAGTETCLVGAALGFSDDVSMQPPAGCTPPQCNVGTGGGGCCSATTVTCPATGNITVMYGAYQWGNPVTCNVATR